MAKEEMTVKQYRELPKKKKGNKYGNKIIKTPEGTFQSVWEYKYWGTLKMMQMAGEIKNLRKQKTYYLIIKGIEITTYRADFVYEDKHGNTIVVDTKSKATVKLEAFKIKMKLMQALLGIKVQVVFRSKK